MKDFILRLAFLAFLIVLLPCLSIYFFNDSNEPKQHDKFIKLIDYKTNEINEIQLEEYIIGVVAAEMPASFEQEALKAQAVAARTYALRKINSSADIHNGADLCTDFAHCQAYITKEEMKKNWGKDFEDNYQKIRNSVESTSGEYLTYDGEIAITVFHSCSNGITEKASDVWGGDIPYLINVESSGDFDKPDFETKTEITKTDFINKIAEILGYSPDDSNAPIGEYELSDGNNVNSVILFGEKISGVDLRSKLGLKSTSFEIEYSNEVFTFCVKGSGHGVGMSQYGANGYSKQGKNYIYILSHYYPGTEICNLNK